VVRFADHDREIKLPDGSEEPRTLLTYVRYPVPRSGSAPSGPFPLVVFGHGYSLTPAPYRRLLDAWARAGYVVAAPLFPLENANAPGGPNEADLVNQPRDVSFVVSRLLALSAAAGGAFSHLIDPTRIAVAGHSDGGDTALATAYDRNFRDPRVKAAVILSGAEIPGLAGFRFRPGEPPLLATQGTADTINPPAATFGFYDAARPPKYLLSLPGAQHLGPYVDEQPQLGTVEKVTTAFLDRYLKGDLAAGRRIAALGSVPGVASVSANP
jgi:predicted dienelactone hydrolase